jgi:hypothetical protein
MPEGPFRSRKKPPCPEQHQRQRGEQEHGVAGREGDAAGGRGGGFPSPRSANGPMRRTPSATDWERRLNVVRAAATASAVRGRKARPRA